MSKKYLSEKVETPLQAAARTEKFLLEKRIGCPIGLMFNKFIRNVFEYESFFSETQDMLEEIATGTNLLISGHNWTDLKNAGYILNLVSDEDEDRGSATLTEKYEVTLSERPFILEATAAIGNSSIGRSHSEVYQLSMKSPCEKDLFSALYIRGENDPIWRLNPELTIKESITPKKLPLLYRTAVSQVFLTLAREKVELPVVAR